MTLLSRPDDEVLFIFERPVHAYPNGNLRGVTSKRRNVLLQPVKSQTLIAQAYVGITRTGNFLALEESPRAQAVCDRDADDWFADRNAVIHDERKVVSLISSASLLQVSSFIAKLRRFLKVP